MISSMEIRFNVVMFNNISKCFTCHANLTFIQIKFVKKKFGSISWKGVPAIVADETYKFAQETYSGTQ